MAHVLRDMPDKTFISLQGSATQLTASVSSLQGSATQLCRSAHCQRQLTARVYPRPSGLDCIGMFVCVEPGGLPVHIAAVCCFGISGLAMDGPLLQCGRRVRLVVAAPLRSGCFKGGVAQH